MGDSVEARYFAKLILRLQLVGGDPGPCRGFNDVCVVSARTRLRQGIVARNPTVAMSPERPHDLLFHRALLGLVLGGLVVHGDDLARQRIDVHLGDA